ncbi:alpha-glucosidase [Paenibacillus cellulositrophicus]|uniref:glycoside hydrolase family 13 protein n=1 Tax=Paenibacillus cellulositrophicus TaxID=562959 RepID=UPI002041E10A|nr:alpha-glucosidase [Paenibacillus cellulositrophicus]MCM2996901.1 alpha-glucosidase [Paenibacillus cellulositrophicus]
MNETWWKEAAVYEIYPVSFMDTNGDGKGDLRGIISKLDYLKDLGIDVIWICPIYESPGKDNGYDISDYYAINPEFGTMEDFDDLLQEAHARGMNIMMDLVLNHTSDQHPWFKESRSSTDNPQRSFYIWRKGVNGLYPNNWESYFSGSVWEMDPETDEYYMHLYSKHQPDLNWRNENMVHELYKMIRWWLEKGVDGFRFDAIAHIVKAKGLPDADNPQHLPVVRAYQLFSNLEKVHFMLKKLNEEVLMDYDIMTVGETSGLGPEQALEYVGDQRHELNMVFQFEHMTLDSVSNGTGKWETRAWTLLELKKIMSRWQTTLHNQGWNANYLGNHDQPRAVSRFGNDKEYRVQSAKMLATFMLTLEGTPYIYQGEEIGMTNAAFDQIGDYRDVETLNYYEQSHLQGKPIDQTMQAIQAKSRDNARTPMQWDNGPQAGFTTGEPWIKVNPNYTDVNVASAMKDPDSIYHYYKRMLSLRKTHKALIYGEYKLLLPLDPDLYVYTRTLDQDTILVILNFFDDTPVMEWPKTLRGMSRDLLISNYDLLPDAEGDRIELRPYEARVYRLT